MKSFVEAIENGLSCFPVDSATGAPAKGISWGVYCDRLPTYDEAEKWDQEYPINGKYGIAIAFGPASGLCGIDDDTGLSEVKKIIPQSPYAKRGRLNHETRFFKYTDRLKGFKESKGNKRVAFWTRGHYTIIPPSLHRETGKEYVWVGKGLDDLDRDELPEITDLSWHDLLPSFKKEELGEKGFGRNNKHVEMVTAAFAKGKSDLDIVDEIYKYDLNNGKLFWDASEKKPAKDEFEARYNARCFVTSVIHSIIKEVKPEITIVRDESEIDFTVNNGKHEPRPIPVPRYGFIRSFVEAASASSRFDVSSLAVGGALSLLSVISSNRRTFRGFAPNEMFLGIAPSGSGKAIVTSIQREILAGTKLLSAASGCQSAQAFVVSLPEQPERLDIVDEGGTLLELWKPRKGMPNIFVDIINELYTQSTRSYAGLTSLAQGKNYGACWCPCVSIFATTHEAGLYQAMTGYLGESGLMPRFLVIDNGSVRRNERARNPEETKSSIEEMKEFIRRFNSVYPMITDKTLIDTTGPGNKRPFPKEASITDAASRLLDEYERHTAELFIKASNHGDNDAPYISRQYEHVCKMTLDCNGGRENDEVEPEDVDYAISVVETIHHNSSLLRNRIVNSGKITGPLAKVENSIKSKGVISRTDLVWSTDLSGRDLDTYVSLLEDEGKVEVLSVNMKNSRKKSTLYRWAALS